jgi:hypothetical protein
LRQFALILAWVFACGSVAAAAVDPGALREAGDWRLSAVGGRIACTLTFTTQAGVGGYEVKAPLACRRAFPALKDVAAWAVDDKGGIVLSDAKAAMIVTFPAQGASPYEAKAPDGHTWRLEPLKPLAEPPAPTPPTPVPPPVAPPVPAAPATPPA